MSINVDLPHPLGADITMKRGFVFIFVCERYEMEPGEESPLGLLLCTEGSEEQIELLQLDKSGIKVASTVFLGPPEK